jgi:hypothetical protein
MHKNILLMFLSIFIAYISYSQEKINILFEPGFGTIGGGINYFDNKVSGDFTENLFNLRWEFSPTGLGFQITPLKYEYSKIFDKHLMSFSNMKIFWNMFGISINNKHANNQNIFGPFVSINALNLENFDKFFFDKIIFRTGFEFILKVWFFDMISIETGYQNYNGRHSFFMLFKVDNLMLFMPIIELFDK